jgi:hypothetical protein
MKSYRGIKALALSLMFYLVFNTGCYYDQVLPPEPGGSISYAGDMQPFFDKKCVSCHNGTGIPLNLEASGSYSELIFGNYIDTSDPANSKLYVKMTPGESMEQYATDMERSMTLKWIEQGAKNN